MITQSKLPSFQELVDRELSRIRAKPKNRDIAGYHEAYGLILEELDEFWDEVRKKDSSRDVNNALKELVQIAALCAKAAQDLKMIRDSYAT